MTSYGDFPSNVDRQSWFARDASKVKHYVILIAYVGLLVSNSDPVMGFEATQLHAGYYFDQHIVSSQCPSGDFMSRMNRLSGGPS